MSSRGGRRGYYTAGAGYADYVPPQGMAWVWWQVTRPARYSVDVVRSWYFRVFPPPEVAEFIGARVRVVPEARSERDLPRGAEGVVVGSQAHVDQRIYHIRFDRADVFTSLPNPEHFELVDPAGGPRP